MSDSTRPQYWRMQLHPHKPKLASFHAAQSLSAGFIGLDFSGEVGDLFRTTHDALPLRHRDYWAFGHEMHIGDLVLVIVHHFPFALATIHGDYNYIREPVPEIGVWFRHFRRVKDVKYYSDRVTNVTTWDQLTMTDTISPLRDPQSASWKVIESWH